MTLPRRPIDARANVVARLRPSDGERTRSVRAVRRGFTLLEIFLVLGLLIILSTLILPNFQKQRTANELTDSAENVRVGLRMARATASMSGRRYRIRWEPKVQQPFIEYEVDAMREPNKWEASTETWVESVRLLNDIQIVTVKRGRPEYLTPVSHGGGEVLDQSLSDQNASFEKAFDSGAESEGDEEIEGEEGEESQPSKLSAEASEHPEDPDRATIEFDIDGSSDWYTLTVAKSELGQEIDERTRQLWIILDGRTGLARIEEGMTPEQLADISLRPNLDKLQPPDKPLDEMGMLADMDGLSGLMGGAGGLPGSGSPAGGTGAGGGPFSAAGQSDSGQGQLPELPAGAADDIEKAVDDAMNSNGGGAQDATGSEDGGGSNMPPRKSGRKPEG